MKKIIILVGILVFASSVKSQNFEEKKSDLPIFENLKVKVGGDFAIQLQGLSHSNTNDTIDYYDLVTNFNLPTANLNLNVFLADGVKMYLRTYLSSRHHNETWVKGGYVQLDKLDFISDGFLSGVMNVVTLKFGLDEINYGDAHFRRTDNAHAINNPFVGNYIMDAFTTEAYGEVYILKSGFVGVIGVSNGKLNQNVTVTTRSNNDNALSVYGKLGYDKQFNEDFRARLTGSWYLNQGTSTGTYLYGGDRTGSRYYSVLVVDGEGDNYRSGRFNPGFTQITAFQINPFIKYKGLEFFGIYELANGGENDGDGSYSQIAADLLYRFGGKEQFYVGGRYNMVSGKQTSASDQIKIDRINVGGGWFLTENVIAKLEYVSQKYTGDGIVSTLGASYKGAEFNGFMIEAAISF
ncbi:MAG TPA: hypothetical protein DCG75_16875 [Bacteroidales bacterium]|jgi:hypothetical protein|nr:hypothetical protein [Bacteroidales bacterium]